MIKAAKAVILLGDSLPPSQPNNQPNNFVIEPQYRVDPW